jgi:hypothetical protein
VHLKRELIYERLLQKEVNFMKKNLFFVLLCLCAVPLLGMDEAFQSPLPSVYAMHKQRHDAFSNLTESIKKYFAPQEEDKEDILKGIGKISLSILHGRQVFYSKLDDIKGDSDKAAQSFIMIYSAYFEKYPDVVLLSELVNQYWVLDLIQIKSYRKFIAGLLLLLSKEISKITSINQEELELKDYIDIIVEGVKNYALPVNFKSDKTFLEHIKAKLNSVINFFKIFNEGVLQYFNQGRVDRITFFMWIDKFSRLAIVFPSQRGSGLLLESYNTIENFLLKTVVGGESQGEGAKEHADSNWLDIVGDNKNAEACKLFEAIYVIYFQKNPDMLCSTAYDYLHDDIIKNKWSRYILVFILKILKSCVTKKGRNYSSTDQEFHDYKTRANDIDEIIGDLNGLQFREGIGISSRYRSIIKDSCTALFGGTFYPLSVSIKDPANSVQDEEESSFSDKSNTPGRSADLRFMISQNLPISTIDDFRKNNPPEENNVPEAQELQPPSSTILEESTAPAAPAPSILESLGNAVISFFDGIGALASKVVGSFFNALAKFFGG